MANPVIAEKLASFNIEDFQPIVKRDLDLGAPLVPKAGNLVKVVTGMRRSGKSYRLFQEMERLHQSGISCNRICYFNFEDDRLGSITSSVGDEVLETFFAAHPEALREGSYLFFDELQEMHGWGAWLRRVVDSVKATIYVSGSSSKMLSSEIATEFRGRALDFELLPYSFREFVRSYNVIDSGRIGIGNRTGDDYSLEERLALQQAMKDYLTIGGFPAVQGLPIPQRIALLQSYVQRVVLRDVVERHNIARPRVASALARRALGSNGKQLSLRKVENDLRSVGLSTSRELLGDLLGYFEDAYLLFRVRELSMSLSERTTSLPKIYAIDPGLAAAVSSAATREDGQRLEEAVYLELRRRNIGLRRDGIASFHTREHAYEIDFVVGDALESETYELYQVTASMDDEMTVKRETRALWEMMSERDLNEGIIIVGDGAERDYEHNGSVIHQIPAWKWFLRG